jgi:GNAT superfamily N-acetyltransferase
MDREEAAGRLNSGSATHCTSAQRMIVTITEEHDNSGSIPDAVRAGIRAADPPALGRRDYAPLVVAMRDQDGTLVGGAYGATMWEWLMLDGLWIADECRRQGHGLRLLTAVEEVARQRGCRGATLGTFDFQARQFYERNGYQVYGELPDFPPGHVHFELMKRLDAS